MGLYQKYRPTTLDKVIGNEQVVSSLQKLLAKPKNKIPHAFLFIGPTGCGKTTMARIVANELGSTGTDYKEIDSGQFRGIDTARELRKQMQYRAMEGSARVFVIDEVHKMTNDAQNALLKALEDTPEHVYFILCTTDPQKLIKTVKGRCSTYEMQPLEEKHMVKLLFRIARSEGGSIEKPVLKQIHSTSNGHPRNAIQILEQVLGVDADERMEFAKRAEALEAETIELARALVKGSSWHKVAEILQGLKGQDAETVRRVVLGYCQTILLNKRDDHVAGVMEEMVEPFYNSGFPGLVFACYSIVNQ